MGVIACDCEPSELCPSCALDEPRYDKVNVQRLTLLSTALVPRPNFSMDLREYERLVDEFADEKINESSHDENVLRRLYLGEFVLWLRKRQENTNATTTK